MTTGIFEGVVYNYDSGAIIGNASIFTLTPSHAVTSNSVNGVIKIEHVAPAVYRLLLKKQDDSSSVSISVMKGGKTVADIALKDTSSTS